MEYNIGDRVKIVENLKELREEGRDITTEMLEFAGMYAIIKIKYLEPYGRRYLLDIDNEEWLWYEDFLLNWRE